jgi:hypothetical protein
MGKKMTKVSAKTVIAISPQFIRDQWKLNALVVIWIWPFGSKGNPYLHQKSSGLTKKELVPGEEHAPRGRHGDHRRGHSVDGRLEEDDG